RAALRARLRASRAAERARVPSAAPRQPDREAIGAERPRFDDAPRELQGEERRLGVGLPRLGLAIGHGTSTVPSTRLPPPPVNCLDGAVVCPAGWWGNGAATNRARSKSGRGPSRRWSRSPASSSRFSPPGKR